jgi:hypothetical protein
LLTALQDAIKLEKRGFKTRGDDLVMTSWAMDMTTIDRRVMGCHFTQGFVLRDDDVMGNICQAAPLA